MVEFRQTWLVGGGGWGSNLVVIEKAAPSILSLSHTSVSIDVHYTDCLSPSQLSRAEAHRTALPPFLASTTYIFRQCSSHINRASFPSFSQFSLQLTLLMQDRVLETESCLNPSTTISQNEAAPARCADGQANCAALRIKHVRQTP